MAEFTFSCPHCGQHVACDVQWGGHTIACPACQGQMTVPSPAQPPAPMPALASAPALAPRPAPSRVASGTTRTPAQRGSSLRKPAPSTGNKVAKIAVFTMVFAVAAVGGYFGIRKLIHVQDQLNEKRREGEKDSGGGEVGHIADLHNMLEVTDVMSGMSDGDTGVKESGRVKHRASGSGLPGMELAEGDEPAAPPEKELPVIPAVWSLDANAVQIPESKVNGKISGTNFVAEIIQAHISGGAHVLSFRQGKGQTPDREMLVYLKLKPGEQLAGQTWTITKEMKGSTVPQVAKRWKPNPKYAAQQKFFATGYAMKLELGPQGEEYIPGKVFIALPDPEQSVVAGVFRVLPPSLPRAPGSDMDSRFNDSEF